MLDVGRGMLEVGVATTLFTDCGEVSFGCCLLLEVISRIFKFADIPFANGSRWGTRVEHTKEDISGDRTQILSSLHL